MKCVVVVPLVVAAAIRVGDLICSVKRPGRHHDVMQAMQESGMPPPRSDGEQGFLLNSGCFVGRAEAMRIARAQGQLIPRDGGYRKGEINSGTDLFSEDLW